MSISLGRGKVYAKVWHRLSLCFYPFFSCTRNSTFPRTYRSRDLNKLNFWKFNILKEFDFFFFCQPPSNCHWNLQHQWTHRNVFFPHLIHSSRHRRVSKIFVIFFVEQQLLVFSIFFIFLQLQFPFGRTLRRSICAPCVVRPWMVREGVFLLLLLLWCACRSGLVLSTKRQTDDDDTFYPFWMPSADGRMMRWRSAEWMKAAVHSIWDDHKRIFNPFTVTINQPVVCERVHLSCYIRITIVSFHWALNSQSKCDKSWFRSNNKTLTAREREREEEVIETHTSFFPSDESPYIRHTHGKKKSLRNIFPFG